MTKLPPAFETARPRTVPVAGNPANHMGPVALRPRLAAGLPLATSPGLQCLYRPRSSSALVAQSTFFGHGALFRRALKGPARGPFVTQVICYLIRSKILNIGMYSAMTIAPTMPPSTAIMIGSINDVSDSVVDSTS